MTKRLLYIFVTILILTGCANMAQGPTGGKRDMTAPTFVKSFPTPNSLNVKEKRIEIDFNEYLQLDNPSQKLIISPPQKSTPTAKAIGKKIIVELKDSLQPNTTYTIDFNNSIGDFTENNIVNDFIYTFSTGDVLDTLTISGTVLNAEDLTPANGITVGIYSSDVDSLFTTTRFERIGKTNASGRFSIRGVKAQHYRIFALEDLNNNNIHDQEGEGIAFQEMELPIPSVESTIKWDTIYKDSATIDTIRKKVTHKFLPDSFMFRLFHKEIRLQEFKKIERTDRKYFTLFFKKMEKSIPTIQPVNFKANDWFILEPSRETDTLKYWITDTTIMKMDSLKFVLSYLKTDSIGKLIPQSDTLIAGLNFTYLKEESKKLKAKEANERKYEKRGLKRKRTNILKTSSKPNSVEIEDTARIEWVFPVKQYDMERIHLYYKKDTDDIEIPIQLKLSANRRDMLITSEIVAGTNYKLILDSAAVFDFYGNHNEKEKISFSKKEEDDYGTITMNLTNTKGNIIVQLMGATENIVKEQKNVSNKVIFNHLHAGTYFVKIIVDTNNDGKWTTGDYKKQLQPEEVYYFYKPIRLRKGWSVEEDWNIQERKIDQQRPGELKKKEKKKE